MPKKDTEINAAIQQSVRKYFNLKADRTLTQLSPDQFIPGLDIEMMYRDMYWASEGYLWEMVRRGHVDVDQMEKGFLRLMDFWYRIGWQAEWGDGGNWRSPGNGRHPSGLSEVHQEGYSLKGRLNGRKKKGETCVSPFSF